MGRRTIPAIMLCIFLLCPIVAAQTPWPSSVPYRIDISAPGSTVVDYMGSSTVDITISDESYDAYASQGIEHVVSLSSSIVSLNSTGWSANINPSTFIGTTPGNTYTAKLTVSAGTMIKSQTAIINITAKIEGWATAYDYAQIFVSVNSTPRYTILPADAPVIVKPYSDIVYRVKISNFNVYPQKFKAWATVEESGWKAIAQQYIALGPLESNYINVSIESPDSQFYFRGSSGIINVFVEPVDESEYRQMIPLVATVRGFYLSPWFYYVWLPIFIACCLVSGLSITRKIEKKYDERIAVCGRKPKMKEFGKEEKMRLAQVRKERPQIYERLMQKRESEYDIRLQKYNTCLKIYREKKILLDKKRREIDRIKTAEGKITKKERASRKKEERKLRKEKRKAEKKMRAARRKLEKKARKIKKKQDKRNSKNEGKERKKMKKELAAKKKELEKLSAKKRNDSEKEKNRLIKQIEKKKAQQKKAEKKNNKSASMIDGGRIE